MKKFLWVGVVAAVVSMPALSEVVDNAGDQNSTVIEQTQNQSSNIDSGNVTTTTNIDQSQKQKEDVRINSPESDRKTKIVIAPQGDANIAYQPTIQASGIARPIERRYAPSLMPLVGSTIYAGGWNRNVENQITLGLVGELPLTSFVSLEAEGSYSSNMMASLQPVGILRERFDVYSVGGNGKVYLSRGTFQPYVGAGMHALFFQGPEFGTYGVSQLFGPQNPNNAMTFNGQVMAGADIQLTDSISVGPRASWTVPLFNRPNTVASPNNAVSAPFSVYNNLMNTSYFKVGVGVRVSL